MKSDEIMDVALRRGFIFPSSEIYGGFSGFYDYGHLGTLMRRKWEDAWRKHYLRLNSNFFEIDATNICQKCFCRLRSH